MQLIGTEGLSKLYTQSFSLLHLKTLWRARWPAACACAAAPPPASPLWPRLAAPQNNQHSTLYPIFILLSFIDKVRIGWLAAPIVTWDVDFDGVNSILRRVTCCEESRQPYSVAWSASTVTLLPATPRGYDDNSPELLRGRQN